MVVRKTACRVLSFIASAALAFGLVPAASFAELGGVAFDDTGAAYAQPASEDAESSVRAMLGSGSYVEGEAVVCYLEPDGSGAGTLSVQSAQADSLLSSAEDLSAVTARQYGDAVGESAGPATGRGKLTAQAAEGNDAVKIAIVREDSMDTAQLLEELLVQLAESGLLHRHSSWRKPLKVLFRRHMTSFWIFQT